MIWPWRSQQPNDEDGPPRPPRFTYRDAAYLMFGGMVGCGIHEAIARFPLFG